MLQGHHSFLSPCWEGAGVLLLLLPGPLPPRARPSGGGGAGHWLQRRQTECVRAAKAAWEPPKGSCRGPASQPARPLEAPLQEPRAAQEPRVNVPPTLNGDVGGVRRGDRPLELLVWWRDRPLPRASTGSPGR